MAEPIFDQLGNFAGYANDETPQQSVSNTANTAKSSGTHTEFLVGTRRSNPLSQYASYTYQISLYMITPDALDLFNETGRKNIYLINNGNQGSLPGAGAYLLAQSGGIASDSYRAPGFNYDFYIDNLVIDSVVNGTGTGGPTIVTTFNFNITETNGFSFVTNIKRAKNALNSYSTTVNYKDSTNTSRQFFILGIKFLGYDSHGNLVSDNSDAGTDTTYQKFYDILITDIKFRIDGKAITYNIVATAHSLAMAMGRKRGVIDKGSYQLTGKTVGDILNKLMTTLNDEQNKQVNSKSRLYPNTYNIEFFDDATLIDSSDIVSKVDLSKIKWPMAVPKDISSINPALEIKTQPNSFERTIAFNGDTPIVQAISSVINQSDYLTKGLIAIYSSTEDSKIEPEAAGKKLKWFNITPIVKKAKFDTLLNDWAMDITYQIRTYEIPMLNSEYASKTTRYYGAHKRYDYWYTGNNSEIIKYEHTINSAYFTVALDSVNKSKNAVQLPVAIGKRQPVDRLGKLDVGFEAQNNVMTQLIDPGSWANATIEVLGDPDWMSNPGQSTQTKKSFYMNDGFTVDFASGQIFIEIRFLEGVDYEHDNGLMKINSDILFWDYPVSVAEKLDGAISYLVTGVKHIFRSGKFTQVLSCVINPFFGESGLTVTEQYQADRENEVYDKLENLRFKNRSTGLKVDNEVTAGTTAGNQTIGNANQSSTQNTNTKGIADDDAAGYFPQPYNWQL